MGHRQGDRSGPRRRVIDVNVLGVIRMMKAVLPHMAVYVAAKHALEGYWSRWTTKFASTAYASFS
jgi:NAD(P)-dependent dehydrogenase (short-subunit alcohol dehydrogenase family)